MRTTQHVGKTEGTCSVISKAFDGSNLSCCTYTVLRTSWGTISVQGYVPDLEGNRFDLPITGGSGIWKSASGVATATIVKPGYIWTYHIKLDKAGACWQKKCPERPAG
ncbi:hypothetical protein GPECTOR_4g959 [Gonium pectorale]|uniref:Allene oxide cyclase barrel-like domain-containing protein n=1 Tax=Gonium pectorale TaxID=33097 RepID=A0A150GYA9_GONPE|nr:hypothetical protein GPECTOR_4g959 [Gonium pectorale]|eukprot:KXZ54887.1 hypothetical protein GPECTOR_4g959 [Gonium pectorale]